jgi:diacylglycerol kinase family enzyme
MQQDRWGILYCPKGHNNKQRERIQKALDERQVQYDFVQSESTDSVERLVTMLIHNGYKTIVVVGGDSALNDAVNCLMKEEKQVRDQISLGVIPNGAMNDFARYWDFKEGNLEQTVDWLVKHRVRKIDLGCIRYQNKQG